MFARINLFAASDGSAMGGLHCDSVLDIAAGLGRHLSAKLIFMYGQRCSWGGLSLLPVFLTLVLPGRAITRHTIAVAQMLTSALLIHLMGGRIETHFHVFGSLAFLAVYRDWRVFITATVVVAGDHLLRGIFWPQSVYGVLRHRWFRTLEHAAWVVFEDVILIRTIYQSTSEMREIAVRRAELEMTNVQRRAIGHRTHRGTSRKRRARRTIINMSSDAFVAMNGEGQIVEWNREAEKTFGYSHDEVLGKSLTETIIPTHTHDRRIKQDWAVFC